MPIKINKRKKRRWVKRSDEVKRPGSACDQRIWGQRTYNSRDRKRPITSKRHFFSIYSTNDLRHWEYKTILIILYLVYEKERSGQWRKGLCNPYKLTLGRDYLWEITDLFIFNSREFPELFGYNRIDLSRDKDLQSLCYYRTYSSTYRQRHHFLFNL